MRNSFFHQFLASALGGLCVLALIAGLVVLKLSGGKEKIRDRSWLIVDLYGGLPEYDLPGGLPGAVMGGDQTLQQVLTNLEMARADERIAGVILKLSANMDAGAGKLQELRDAIHATRAAGKKVVGWADSMERGTVWLAAACDTILMPPTGYLQFVGFAQSSLHLKNLFDKAGVKENLHKIKDYKAAAEMLQRADASPEAVENREWMMRERWEMLVSDLQADRGLSGAQVTALMQRALFTPEEAVAARLVDRLAYWDELEAALKGKDDERLRTVSAERYASEKPAKLGLKGKKTIAVIHAHGMLGGRESRVDPLLGPMIGHETVCAEFRRARRDEKVAAVVFRIDSSGGEALCSDLIGHEVEITAKVKPVVVSMVDVAASGGYHVSYRASRIVALPATTTGSIGSISGKVNIKGLLDRLGVTYSDVTLGPNALLGSDRRDYTPEEWEIFTRNHWADFNAWLADVAEHRGLPFAEAEKLAHGRVWTGRQAVQNRLIDETGGLPRAIAAAKELAKIAADDKVTVAHFPEKQGLLATLTSGGGSDKNGGQAAALDAVGLAGWRAREALGQTWRLLTGAPLLMAPAWAQP